MISSKKIVFELWQKYNMYLILFIIFSPIFISLDFSQGLKFDGYYFNQYSSPSIPLSSILIAILALLNFKRLIVNKKLIILASLILIYVIANLYYDTTRALIVGVGMILPICTYYIFKDNSENVKVNYDILYKVLFFVIVLKFLFDIFLYQLHLFHDNLYTGQILQKTIFATPFYVYNKVVIYNYYDYFPFIYYLSIALSFQNIINKEMIKKSILLIVISLVAIQDTGSRLFIYGIYLIPFLYIFYKLTKFKLASYFYLFIGTAIAITFITGMMEFKVTDPSLLSRYVLNHSYFEAFSWINLIVPAINEYRVKLSGSLHNELLEIFSFFGFVIIYYYYLVKNMFCNVNNKYKSISYLLIFIIVMGSLIQINLGNPYIGIILGAVLAIISTNNNKNVFFGVKI